MRTEIGMLKAEKGGSGSIPHLALALISHFSLLSLLISNFSLLISHSSSAAQLSLSSTNDYRHISIPASETVDIRGLGTGPEGLYRIPRREDLMFLAEAIFERKYAAHALVNDADTITPDKYPWLTIKRENYALLPNWDGQYIPFYEWYPDGIYYTNKTERTVDRQMVIPQNFIDRPAAKDYSYDGTYTRAGELLPLMFDGDAFPLSRKLIERMKPCEPPYDHPFFATEMLHFGFVTNVYADVIANSAPLYYQRSRGGPEGYVRVSYHDLENDYISGYDYDSHTWKRSHQDDWSYAETNLTPYAKKEYNYTEETTVGKWAHTAARNGTVVAQTQETRTSTDTILFSHVPHITLPKFENGTTLNGVLKAYAIVIYSRSTWSGTNTYHSASKALAIPTTLVYAGTTQEGYPVYRERSITSSASYFEACKRVTRDEPMDGSELAALIPYPEYPQKNSSNVNSVYDRTTVTLLAYIGAADVTFNARVLGN